MINNQEIKTYIEFFYIQPNTNQILRYEIKTRDPLEVEYDDMAVAFRFCDKRGEQFENYSEWYFLGEELSLDEAMERLGHVHAYRPKLERFKNCLIKRVCVTRRGNIIPMSSSDITLNNYKKENEAKIKLKK